MTISTRQRNIEELDGVFKKVLSPKGASSWRCGLKAISSLGQDKKFEAITKALDTSMNDLYNYHSSKAATAEQVSESFNSLAMKAGDPCESRPLWFGTRRRRIYRLYIDYAGYRKKVLRLVIGELQLLELAA